MRVLRVLRFITEEFRSVGINGFASIVDLFLNSSRRWSIKKSNITVVGSEESLSDSSSYLSIVSQAINDESVFQKFKSNKEYREILEHVSRRFGRLYLERINGYTKLSQKEINFVRADYCSPQRFTYPKLGRISPTSLRYIKISRDIVRLFGPTSNFHITEIGIGYGGQAASLYESSGFESYEFVDLPQVKNLGVKYLEKFYPAAASKISSNQEIDLLISNYAFSELNRDAQIEYLNRYVLRSTRGYMIINQIIDNKFQTLSLDEMLASIPNSINIKEIPLTYPGNSLIVWGNLFPSTSIQ